MKLHNNTESHRYPSQLASLEIERTSKITYIKVPKESDVYRKYFDIRQLFLNVLIIEIWLAIFVAT